jgi:MFS transporter, DHA2 family, multidrug resistance protein
LAETEDGLPIGRRRFAVAVVAIGTVMAVLDGSVANVALPTIARELHADAASSIWVVNAYQVVVAMMILPLSSLGDSIGYRRVYAWGIALFTLGSLACALSTTLLALVLARVLQGVGGAAIMSIAPALNRTIFPARMLGVAVGISALTVASSSAAGPTIGGSILAVLPWPWLFAINVPLGIFDTVFALRALPRHPGTGGGLDFRSALLSAPAIALFIIGLDGFARHFPPALIASFLAGSAVCAVAFVHRQRAIPRPMLPLDLFAQSRFSLAAATSFLSFVAQGLAFVVLPFVFQTVDGYSALASGLLFTPWPLAIAVIAPIAGRLSDRYPPPLLSTIGLAIFSAGIALLALLALHPTPLDIAWRAIVCGIGFGFFQAPNNRELLGSVSRARSGSAAGVLATVRVTGQSVGAAFVAIALGALAASNAADAVPNAAALDAPAHVALWTGAACAAAACLVSALRLRRTDA